MKILAIFIFSSVYLLAKVESQEACESYTSYGYYNEERNCTRFCCGSCTARYCCTDWDLRLDQNACTLENCTDYYRIDGSYYEPEDCIDRFCCGWCDYRYCCSSPDSKLNQSSCPEGIPTTTKTTTQKPYSSSSTST